MDIKSFILRQLEKSRGDDLERAMHAWKGLSPAQMNEFYGASGRTRAQILAEYQAHRDQLEEAMAWVRSR